MLTTKEKKANKQTKGMIIYLTASEKGKASGKKKGWLTQQEPVHWQ